MKELIYIWTVVGERLEQVLRIVGETLVDVTMSDTEAVVTVSVTESDWSRIKAQLLAR